MKSLGASFGRRGFGYVVALSLIVCFAGAAGMLVFVAVLSHDFADGLNTVGFILRQSGDRTSAIRWLSVDALAPLAGAIIGSTLSISEHSLGSALAVYAGFFLFLGATDLLPHAHEHPSGKRVLLTVTGFGAVLLTSLIAQHGAVLWQAE